MSRLKEIHGLPISSWDILYRIAYTAKFSYNVATKANLKV